MSIENRIVGLEPFYHARGVIRFKIREHEFTTLLKLICFMVLNSIVPLKRPATPLLVPLDGL
jgi:hypothetical protein